MSLVAVRKDNVSTKVTSCRAEAQQKASKWGQVRLFGHGGTERVGVGKEEWGAEVRLGTHVGGCGCGEEDRGREVGSREGPEEVGGVWHVVCVQVVVRIKTRRVDERQRAGLVTADLGKGGIGPCEVEGLPFRGPSVEVSG